MKALRYIAHTRKMTKVLWIWNAIFAAWIIGGIASASSAPTDANCVQSAGAGACQTAANVGTGIGVALIFGLWFMGFIVLSLAWIMSRPHHTA
jgi:hypothetical protein